MFQVTTLDLYNLKKNGKSRNRLFPKTFLETNQSYGITGQLDAELAAMALDRFILLGLHSGRKIPTRPVTWRILDGRTRSGFSTKFRIIWTWLNASLITA
jgi:hypothetical protein